MKTVKVHEQWITYTKLVSVLLMAAIISQRPQALLQLPDTKNNEVNDVSYSFRFKKVKKSLTSTATAPGNNK